jgi:hypothetical protein
MGAVLAWRLVQNEILTHGNEAAKLFELVRQCVSHIDRCQIYFDLELTINWLFFEDSIAKASPGVRPGQPEEGLADREGWRLCASQ